MGNSYTNITVLGAKHSEVLSVLNEMRRHTCVSPTVNGMTVVYDRACEDLDIEDLRNLASELSSKLNCEVLAALVFDDDVICLQLFNDSEQYVDYVSRGGPHSGAWILCQAFRRKIVWPLLWIVLHFPFFLFEIWRHSIIAKLLGIPEFVVATGYRYIQQGEYAPGLDEDDFERTPF